MATCSCGATSARLKKRSADADWVCPACAPDEFPAQTPQWQTARGAMGWEAYPHMYRKITAPDGSVGYEAKDELRADTEAKLERECEEDKLARERAIAKKRASRRTSPLSPAEVARLQARFLERKREIEREQMLACSTDLVVPE
ncbi:MAG TPA: hypothetical protein VLA89_03285 [Gemmatimonadales bacterium]|nr:hypothetical protein [Gemmatimonadales bacterium]